MTKREYDVANQRRYDLVMRWETLTREEKAELESLQSTVSEYVKKRCPEYYAIPAVLQAGEEGGGG